MKRAEWATLAALAVTVYGAFATLAAGGALAGGGPPRPRPRAEITGGKPNRLAAEKSPYLLQHARNPVDWFPWGEEAFRKAREEDKPLFVSIGYSTCHWCHVMERESFENAEIARVLNEHFVAVKVDREERPDVDEVYMTAVMHLTRRGGWPLSVFLTPEGKPFFGGTYFPPEDDPQRGPGFRPLLLHVAEQWKEDRERIRRGSDAFLKQLARQLAAPPAGKGPPLDRTLLDRAVDIFGRIHDPLHGGFGTAPKFPRTSVLDFLLLHHGGAGRGAQGGSSREMALLTLDRMAAGGIRDHLAGGFHRYSTDREWTVPHFEKMLYDQALIARTYLEAARVTGDGRHLVPARDALDYVLARLTSAEGGFFCAEDADSEGEEGRYYVWSRAEVLALLGEAEGALAADFYGVTAEGNFEGSGRSVLTARLDRAELARKVGDSPESLDQRLAASRRRLLEARRHRVPPARDDKVLTDWNGLAISAMAVAYQATGEERYLRAAERAADFIERRLVQEGRLLHRFRDGQAAIPAFLEDHAFLAAGLLDLYEAGFDLRRLREASRLARELVRLFWDPAEGGFFQTAAGGEALVLRRKEFYDGALPSGNSVAYLVLARLAELTGDTELSRPLATLDRLAARLLEESPAEHPGWLAAALFRLGPPRQVVLVGAASDPLLQGMVGEIHRRATPPRVLVRVEPADLAAARALIPLLEGKEALEAKPTAYVCRGGTCRLPARDLESLRRELAE